MSDFPQIFAFYSFKGGVGRSMAVLNLAYALAAKGRHVLVLDMDLEAPGLSGFLHREKEIAGFARFDMVDLVGWAIGASAPLDPLAFPPLTDYAVSIPREKLEPIPRVFSELGRLDIIPVEEERDYYDRLTGLAMGNYDQNALVRMGSVLREWLKSRRFPVEVPDYYGPSAEPTAAYDYVLVDSRTGITETGGLCIGPLSDQLVIVTALNDQNVEGTKKFLKEVGILGPGDPSEAAAGPGLEPKPYLIVPSLVPAGEIETKRKRLKRLEEVLGKAVVKLSYHPQLALKESIFTRDHRDEYLADEYDALLRQVLRMAGDGGNDSLPGAMFGRSRSLPGAMSGRSRSLPGAMSGRSRSPAELREALPRLLRSASVTGSGHLLDYLLSTTYLAEIAEETDFILWDRVCRVLSSGEQPSRWNILIRWANLLFQWSQHSKDAGLAALRLEAAMGRYEQILQAEEVSPARKAITLVNRGWTYGRQGELEKAIADYTAVLQMPDATADQRAKALFNRGLTYGWQGELEKEIADYTAVLQMPDAPADQKAKALVNRGWTYERQGELKEAITDYTALLQMPDATADQRAITLFNRGWAHFTAGFYHEAIEDGRQAASLDPNNGRVHGNLAIALLVLGQTDDALATYDVALALADSKSLDEMTTDLRNAIETHGPLPGADEAVARVEARRKVLGS